MGCLMLINQNQWFRCVTGVDDFSAAGYYGAGIITGLKTSDGAQFFT